MLNSLESNPLSRTPKYKVQIPKYSETTRGLVDLMVATQNDEPDLLGPTATTRAGVPQGTRGNYVRPRRGRKANYRNLRCESFPRSGLASCWFETAVSVELGFPSARELILVFSTVSTSQLRAIQISLGNQGN